MSHNVFDWYIKNETVFKNSLKIILKRIYNFTNYLTPDYLIEKGWRYDEKENYYYEHGLKSRETIYVRFNSSGFYDILIGEKKCFFGTEKTIEWFELFMLLKHRDNGFYNIIDEK